MGHLWLPRPMWAVRIGHTLFKCSPTLYVIYGESWRHMTTWLSRLLRNWIDLVWDNTCLPYQKLSSHSSMAVDNWNLSAAVIVYLLGPLKNYYNLYNCLVFWELLGFSYFPNSPEIKKTQMSFLCFPIYVALGIWSLDTGERIV